MTLRAGSLFLELIDSAATTDLAPTQSLSTSGKELTS